jgi:hypothetical protein
MDKLDLKYPGNFLAVTSFNLAARLVSSRAGENAQMKPNSTGWSSFFCKEEFVAVTSLSSYRAFRERRTGELQ